MSDNEDSDTSGSTDPDRKVYNSSAELARDLEFHGVLAESPKALLKRLLRALDTTERS